MSENELPNGLVETIGSGTTAEAVDRLVAAIEAHEKFGLIAQVDHAAGAARVGMELTPTVEVFFGNPAGGTPLMLISPTAGIDLPQKMLIIQTESGVRVLHNDPAYIADRHNIPADTPQLAAATGALQAMANVAAGVGN